MPWQLSSIWSPLTIEEVTGPIGMFLAIGLYGKISVHFSRSQLTASARRIHRGVLALSVDYIPGRETISRGSLGYGSNVRTMLFPLLFDESRLSALWWSPYT
jgi:hypothetical protein